MPGEMWDVPQAVSPVSAPATQDCQKGLSSGAPGFGCLEKEVNEEHVGELAETHKYFFSSS